LEICHKILRVVGVFTYIFIAILDKISINFFSDGRIAMNGINRISDPALLKAYTDAVKLELAEEFIMILLAELKRRNLSVPHSSPK